MKTQIVQKVAKVSGVSPEICTKVIDALETVMHEKEGGPSFIESVKKTVANLFDKLND